MANSTIAEKIAQAETERQRISANIAAAYTEAEAKGATMPATENSANLADTVASIPTGTAPTLITKQITENGTYAAADDNADGYSEVAVEVPVPAPVEEKYINFIDYDGTVLYSWTEEELQEATELPPLPTREGYTYQEWNWDLADLKQHDTSSLYVGAICKPSDGSTILDFDFSEGEFQKNVDMSVQLSNDDLIVDWDDGTIETFSNTSTSFVTVALTHNFLSSGQYRVKLKLKNGIGYYKKLSLFNSSRMVCACLSNVSLGEHYTEIRGYDWYSCSCLKTISFSNDTIRIDGSDAFVSCYKLYSLCIPKNTYLAGRLFYNCYSLQRVSLPKNGVTTFSNQMFLNCYALAKISIPDSVTSLGSSVFSSCYLLRKIYIPSSVASIGDNAFFNCLLLNVIDLSDYESVPTLYNSNAFFNGEQVFYVKNQEMLNAFESATNWSAYAGKYVIKGATP